MKSIKQKPVPGEQQAKDDQLPESRDLARRRVLEEQQARDDQLLESYKLAKFREVEQRRVAAPARSAAMLLPGDLADISAEHNYVNLCHVTEYSTIRAYSSLMFILTD